MAGSPTAAWLPKRPEAGPGASASGPRFGAAVGPSAGAHAAGQIAQHGVRATRPFRFGSEDRPDPDPPLSAGSVVGDRYQILALLGEGGMGRVYEAQHVVLRRRVALKLLRRDAAAEAENLARFRQEALAASRIGAPEIVEVVDFASHPIPGGAQTYMVMELLAGESLEAWMDRPGGLAEGLTLLASLCDGLAAAHRADVVHRDIKPANVFVPRADPTLGRQVLVKILDFGIAKITAGAEGFQTRQGSLLGTPYYLAPERVMGAALTGAADVYSVGVILYEMLTGNVPFVADSFMGILANHVHTPALDPRQAAPDRPIPAAVAQLCLRLLAKQPGERPGADAVAAALRGLLAEHGPAIAAVTTGPRGSASAGADTQILAEDTRALPLVGLGSGSTGPGDPTAAGDGRSATRIGHASAAVTQALPAGAETPAKAGPGSEPGARPSEGRGAGPRPSRVGWVLAGVAVVGVAALAVGLAVARPSPETEAPMIHEGAPPPAVAIEPAIEPSSTATSTRTSPVDGPTATTAAEPEVEPAPELASAPDPSPEPPAPAPRARAPRERAEPKPAPAAHDEPASAPVEPTPQPDPPAPEPEPDPELPTIKDDVYD